MGWGAFCKSGRSPADRCFQTLPLGMDGAGGVREIYHDCRYDLGRAVWKMLPSNKGILAVLWELYPNHPNLLAAGFERPASPDWVKKPLLGREGSNVTLHVAGQEIETGGGYGAEGSVYQDVAPLARFDGMYPVIGSWVVGHEEADSAAGIGIRESDVPITTNLSRFVPHVCG